MRTKYANNTNEELLTMSELRQALSEHDLVELLTEIAERLRDTLDQHRGVL